MLLMYLIHKRGVFPKRGKSISILILRFWLMIVWALTISAVGTYLPRNFVSTTSLIINAFHFFFFFFQNPKVRLVFFFLLYQVQNIIFMLLVMDCVHLHISAFAEPEDVTYNKPHFLLYCTNSPTILNRSKNSRGQF